MFRALSTTSGITLLRCPPTHSFIQLWLQTASTTPSKPIKRGRKKPQSADAYVADIKHEPGLLESPKPKRKYTRGKAQTGSKRDDAVVEVGEQKTAGVGTAKKKRTKRYNTADYLGRLASGARDEEGIQHYLKFVYPGHGGRHGIAADGKRVHVLSKSLCGKALRFIVLASPFAYSPQMIPWNG
jgi:hypothetical protein